MKAMPTIPALRRGIGRLVDLAFEGGYGCSHNDDAAASTDLFVLGHACCGQAQHIEAADPIDVDGSLAELETAGRTVLFDEAQLATTPGALHDGAAVRSFGFVIAASTASASRRSSVRNTRVFRARPRNTTPSGTVNRVGCSCMTSSLRLTFDEVDPQGVFGFCEAAYRCREPVIDLGRCAVEATGSQSCRCT